jgi:hypothetical protein
VAEPPAPAPAAEAGPLDFEATAVAAAADPELALRLAAFRATREDPPTEHLDGVEEELAGKHYVAGNERDIAVYREHVKDLGGGYLGVGTEQAYLFIGWQRPELAWLVDYDPYVVWTHDVYFAFLAHAATPDEFMALWEQRAAALGFLEQAYEGVRLKRARKIYTMYRGWIAKRLRALRDSHRGSGQPSFLWEQGDYDAVRRAVAEGRVRPMLANLLERGAVLEIGQAARELGVPIRVLYLSNAEEYWKRYERQFRANVAALPFDERSLVVRTLLTWHVNMDYRYDLQPAQTYLRWLAADWVRNVYDVTRRPRRKPGEPPPAIDFTLSLGEPEQAPHNPAVRALRRGGA